MKKHLSLLMVLVLLTVSLVGCTTTGTPNNGTNGTTNKNMP